MTANDPARFWNDLYGERPQTWSGNPNGLLVDEVAELPPGRALDVGCGEGADAIWLAERGWTVTASDVSTTALERAARRAEEVGVADRIAWTAQDLEDGVPGGPFDLVSACYFHSPVALDRTAVLRAAARAVAPGGTLLVVGHAAGPGGTKPEGVHLPTPDEVLDDLALDDGAWTVERRYEAERPGRTRDGVPTTRTDNMLRVRRTD